MTDPTPSQALDAIAKSLAEFVQRYTPADIEADPDYRAAFERAFNAAMRLRIPPATWTLDASVGAVSTIEPIPTA